VDVAVVVSALASLTGAGSGSAATGSAVARALSLTGLAIPFVGELPGAKLPCTAVLIDGDGVA
jgi:hypothetical protein